MRREVRFLLGEEERILKDIDPNLTVLDYLRTHERRTGTKEGCAEGDCGACTVLLCEPDGKGGLRSWTVNSCIQFVPSLDGRQLLTVEDIGSEEDLHPVQEALVARHGSQCGFCTPGFVMQIYGGWREEALTDRQGVKDWIAGNLCRCTGYGPIVEAALDVADAPPNRSSISRHVKRLETFSNSESLAVETDGKRWFAPRSVDELAEVYAAHPDAVLVAGATDVGLWVTKQHRDLPTLIDVTRIEALKEVTETDGEITFGAAVSHRDATEILARVHADLGEMMRRFASIQIRNAGTIGGNIANGSPIGDLPPALIALGATLKLRKGEAVREILLEDFFIAYGKQDRMPGEFAESVTFQKLGPDSLFSCSKLSKRLDSDISAVLGAFRIDRVGGEKISAIRLAFGGMAGTPKRALAAENALMVRGTSRANHADVCEALGEDFQPLSDMRASAEYRLAAARSMLARFMMAVERGESSRPTRLADLVDG